MSGNDTKRPKRWPVLQSTILALFTILAVGCTILSLGMEGMRHSPPPVSPIDPYYVERWAPSFLATLLLVTLLVRLPYKFLTFMFAGFLLGLVAWFVLEAYRGYAAVGAITAIVAAVAVFAWWSIIGSRSDDSRQGKRA